MSYEIPEVPHHFVVDTEAERNTSWHNGSTVYCKDTSIYYILIGGTWYPIIGIPSGGTTGQVLTKDSNTDYDVSWSAAAGAGLPKVEVFTSDGTWTKDSGASVVEVVCVGGGGADKNAPGPQGLGGVGGKGGCIVYTW